MKLLSKLSLFLILLGLSSCLKQGSKPTIPGVQGPNLNIQDGKIVLSLNMTNVNIAAGVSFPIKKLKHSSIYLGPAFDPNGSSNGTLVKASFDLKDVESDEFRVVPSSTLPDGRDFPFLVDGKLPAYALHVPDAKDMTFYASKKVFGFFLPLRIPDDFHADIHFRIVVNDKSYGVASLIHADTPDEQSGLVVLLTLDDIRQNPSLNKLMRLSKKSKNKLF